MTLKSTQPEPQRIFSVWEEGKKESWRPVTLLKRDSNTGILLWNLLNL